MGFCYLRSQKVCIYVHIYSLNRIKQGESGGGREKGNERGESMHQDITGEER